MGKVPFASKDERFKTDYRTRLKPGPGQYDPNKLTNGAAPGMQTWNNLSILGRNASTSPKMKG